MAEVKPLPAATMAGCGVLGTEGDASAAADAKTVNKANTTSIRILFTGSLLFLFIVEKFY